MTRPAASRSTLCGLLLSLSLPAIAGAQPVSVAMVPVVPLGKKPTLTIKAATRVVDLVLDLTRRVDGAKMIARVPSLNAGQSKVFPIGDGSLGIAEYDGTLTLTHDGDASWVGSINMETKVNSEIRIGYQRDHLHLDRHLLEFQISRPSPQLEAELTVLGDQGEVIGQAQKSWANAAAGKWLEMPWEPSSEGTVMMLKLRVTDPGGWSEETLTPWSVSIPHEDLNFATNSAIIEEAERPKLDAAYEAIVVEVTKAQRLDVRCSLYVSGHTDTVGPRDKNQRLSLERAKAISLYLRKKGLAIKVSYEGFGEDRPKVQTADEVDEPRNRRADYVLTAEAPPSEGRVFRWKEAR